MMELQVNAQQAVPTSLIVRYGFLHYLGEFQYDSPVRPMCGQKVILRTRRGTEVGEVVTTACSGTGCAKAITREKLDTYLKGCGDDYPFATEGRVLRIATSEDLSENHLIQQSKPSYIATCRDLIAEMQLPMKLVEVELLLGGESATFFFTSENRVDFRNLVKQLAGLFHTRIQMHQVGARDEARLVADFETCGQHCCCRQFLKLLKPVNMSAAKIQKATLDPSKISGRCGRLKCCLRYEEETYDQLRRKLPRSGTRVRCAEGIGVVEETMILTQLVKIRLGDGRWTVIANEDILDRDVPEGADEPSRPAPQRGGRDDRPERSDRPGRGDRTPRADRPEGDRPSAARQERVDRPERRPQRPQCPPRLAPEQPVAPAPVKAPAPVNAPSPAPAPANVGPVEDDLAQGPPVNEIQPTAITSNDADNEEPEEGEPSTPASGDQPQGIGMLGRRRRRRRGNRGGR